MPSRHAGGGMVLSNRPETNSDLWEEPMCVPSLRSLSSKHSFGISSFAFLTIAHVSLAFFQGLFF